MYKRSQAPISRLTSFYPWLAFVSRGLTSLRKIRMVERDVLFSSETVPQSTLKLMIY